MSVLFYAVGALSVFVGLVIGLCWLFDLIKITVSVERGK